MSDDHAGDAKTALHRAAFQKCLLNHAPDAFFLDAFDGEDVRAVDQLAGREDARHDGFLVHQNGASAAFAFAAAFLGAGQSEIIAQDVQQPPTGGEAQFGLFAVDGPSSLNVAHGVPFESACRA